VIAADGTRLAAHVSGPADADTTLVLAHGWTLTSAAWRPVIAQLHRIAPWLRVVAYDQRHHGDSDRGGTALSIDLLGADLGAVVDQLAPQGRLLLGGHSMGGMTVLALAAARPELIADRVDGVLLVGTSAGDLAADRGGLLALFGGPVGTVLATCSSIVDGARRFAAPVLPAYRRALAPLLFGPITAPEVVRVGTELIFGCRIRTVVEFVPALREHDKRADLDPLAAVPVHVLVGRYDRLTPPRHARYLAEHIDGAQLTVLPHYGHMLTLECPQLLARSIVALAPGGKGDRNASIPA
jgi:pimeloyl-ACP methyl ester carboxylesterase